MWLEVKQKNVPLRLFLTGDIKIFMHTHIWGTALASSKTVSFVSALAFLRILL